MKPFCHSAEHGGRDVEGALERDVNKHRGGGTKRDRARREKESI